MLVNQPKAQIPIDFDHPVDKLPGQKEFPLNIKAHGRSTKDTILNDLAVSEECLIVTGFTSLSQIIDVFGNDELFNKHSKILLGFEPFVRTRKKWKAAELDQQVRDYWLDKGISPLKCGAVLKTIERIKEGRLEFKILNKLHAKIYVTDGFAVLGSSNFSQSGLVVQHEANIRFPNTSSEYSSIKSIAEYYYSTAQLYSQRMIALLEELLIIVDWHEALARAVSELLEGHYVKEYLKTFEAPGVSPLWPSQEQGIHQGLQILQQYGSLLVADPTGSGKTKMLSTLQIAMINWLWQSGRGLKTNPVVVAPPLVLNHWKGEQLRLKRIFSDPISQGILSMPQSYKNKLVLDTLKIANLLIVDEAHNYLNQFSARSMSIAAHTAEFIVLSTATPINKKAEDLLRLIQLLDPDNLGDKELAEFKILYSNQGRIENSADIIGNLRSYIWKFTLRRTKQDLNNLIAKQPEKYVNALNKQCRYPAQNHDVYDTGETTHDIQIAEQINELTAKLNGAIYLKTIKFPKGRKLDNVESRSRYIEARLNMARALSRYRVQATLRSSRAALIELIEGTKSAEEWAQLESINKDTGNVIKALQELKNNLPTYSEKWDCLPDWLKDKPMFQSRCEEDISIYSQIAKLVKTMSDARELSKTSHLIALMRKHSLVIAFDHTIITLYYLQKLIKEKHEACLVASGGSTSKQQVLESFCLGSQQTNIIALCSDAVSEGVNLQAARAVTMLDMPSVLRLAEQRIGRIDRLDSQHKNVFIYWPNDTEQFALKADRNLIRTSEITKYLMGANIKLPDEFTERYEDLKSMSAADVIEELKANRTEEEAEWEGIRDAFGDVHQLIEGPRALLTSEQYLAMVNSKASVRCRLSFVKAKKPWCFIAIRGNKETACRWIFITDTEQVYTDYGTICALLRSNLEGGVSTKYAAKDLNRFIEIFRLKERHSLPHKKRRALEVAEHILINQKRLLNKFPDPDMLNKLHEVLELFKVTDDEIAIDFDGFSLQWLDLLNPRLKALREKHNKRQFRSLEDLKPKYKEYQFSPYELDNILKNIPLTEPFDLQIAACVVGVTE
jgi:hypothetical protein